MNAERPIRVLHVLGRLARGGAEMRTLDAMRRLDRERFKLDFCCLSGLPGPLDDEARSMGALVHLLKLDWRFPWRFVRLLRREQYDVVHAHVHYPTGVILTLAAMAGVKVRITHFRSTNDGRRLGLGETLRRGILKLMINRSATAILGVCEGALASAWSPDWAKDRRCHVVYNGLDLAKYAAQAGSASSVRAGLGLDDGPVCIHVGRLDPPKNHLRLVEIFADLRRLAPDAQLLIVGRGGNAIEQRCRARANELRLGDVIHFLGERDDVPRLLAAADLMIYPSLWEGLPGAVLEALAAGVPVLASEIPGVCEIAERTTGVTTLPLVAGDSEWAERAASMFLQKQAASVETGGPFDIDRCARQLMSIWTGDQGR